jgi:hypothetical protein
MATSVKLEKTNGKSITVSVLRYIAGGNWIQLKHFGANRLYSDESQFFSKKEDMGNGETQLTLEDDVTLSDV